MRAITKVFFGVAVTFDGCIAGPNRGPNHPLGDGGMEMPRWMFRTAYFRELHVRPGGSSLVVARDPEENEHANRGIDLEVVPTRHTQGISRRRRIIHAPSSRPS